MQYKRLAFGDCEEGAIEKALSILGGKVMIERESAEAKLLKWCKKASIFMESVELEVSNLQLAIALVLCFTAAFPG